jgi:hypothetical protein
VSFRYGLPCPEFQEPAADPRGDCRIGAGLPVFSAVALEFSHTCAGIYCVLALLTTLLCVVILSNMKAQQLLSERIPQGDDAFAELRCSKAVVSAG